MTKPAPSASGLFQARKPKIAVDGRQLEAIADLPVQRKPRPPRDSLDYDPTPPSATRSFLEREITHIRKHGNTIWENAIGAGHMAKVFQAEGFDVIGSDLEDRGWPGVILKSFFEFDEAPAGICITNPPYGLTSARDGGCAWVKHSIELGIPYFALLLSNEWPAARLDKQRVNVMDAIFDHHPPSIEYLCCWKIDFRGQGQPAQRNSFFVWDANRPAPGPNVWLKSRLYLSEGGVQSPLI